MQIIFVGPTHNTDYGTLPADLFEPDSSDKSCSPQSAPLNSPVPALLASPPPINLTSPQPTTPSLWAEQPSTTTPSSTPGSPNIMLTSVPHGWVRKIEIGKFI